jgi:hypothetical protein
MKKKKLLSSGMYYKQFLNSYSASSNFLFILLDPETYYSCNEFMSHPPFFIKEKRK